MRISGDRNLTTRELRFKAQVAVKNAEINVLKAKLKVKELRQRELRERI